jgi:penicillin-binding protein 1A
MTGGFSYPLSQLNRTTQAVRQPKLDHQAAELSRAVSDRPATQHPDQLSSITLPPINGGRSQNDYWTPKNYDSGGGVMTLRSALENSKNLATVNLLQGGIDAKPDASLDRLCELALEAQIYKECIRFYPFVSRCGRSISPRVDGRTGYRRIGQASPGSPLVSWPCWGDYAQVRFCHMKT